MSVVENFDDMLEAASLEDAIVAEALELAAKLRRESEEFLFIARTKNVTPYELREASEGVVNTVYELEQLLAETDEDY